MKKLLLLFLIVSQVIVSYSQEARIMQKKTSKNEIRIDLYSAYQNKAPILQISQFAEDIEFIPLETNEKCLLDDYLKNIIVTKDDIIVFDYNGCYRFNRNGKFLNKIGTKGNGPGEYTKPMSIVVDTLNHWVYFSDYHSGRFVKYDYSGRYLEDLRVENMGSHNTLYKPQEIIVEKDFYQFAPKEERYSLLYYSESQKKIISKMRCDYDKEIPRLAMCNPISYSYKGGMYMKDFWCDTIYQLTNPQKLVSHAIINRGRLGYRTQDDKSLISGVEDSEERITIAVHSIAETDRFIFIGSNQGRIVYDKKSDKTIAANYDVPLMDDLYGSPGLVYFVSTANENEVYQAIHAYEFIENGDGKHSITDARYDAYRKMVDGLDEEDNPVIMIVKIKK